MVNYAYHLDAGRYARFLRGYAEKRGVVRLEGKVNDVAIDGESGFVSSITLEDGTQIAGDLFIDCSGFRGVGPIEQALKTGYAGLVQLPSLRPCSCPPCEREDGEAAPALHARNGAQGRLAIRQVPLQHRNGNGHVYCSHFMTDDEALDILVKNIAGKPGADPNFLRFTTGRRKKFWTKNAVAWACRQVSWNRSNPH